MGIKAKFFLLALCVLTGAATSATAETRHARDARITPPITNIYQPDHSMGGASWGIYSPNWGWRGNGSYEDAARRDHQMNRGF
jgi:hypothetical protein